MSERIYTLGIDQGSSSTKAVLLNRHDEVQESYHIKVSTQEPMLGGAKVEQNPSEILDSVQEILQKAQSDCLKFTGRIEAIGLSCQRSAVCAWDSISKKPLHALLTHRDSRATEPILRLSESQKKEILQRTGLQVLPNRSGPKFAFLQGQFKNPSVHVGTLDSFILDGLSACSAHSTEDSMAARSMIYDLNSCRWDQDLCALLGVDYTRLSLVRPSLGEHGRYNNIPISGMLGDQQSNLLYALKTKQEAVLNLGTIASICVPSSQIPDLTQGFVPSIFYSEEFSSGPRQYKYLVEAVITACGPVMEYASKNISKNSDLKALDDMYQTSLGQEASQELILFLPLGGTSSPHWETGLTALVSNAQKNAPYDLVRALINNVAGFIIYNLLEMRRLGLLNLRGNRLLVTGGLNKVASLVQFIADCSGLELWCCDMAQGSAKGAAIAARYGVLKEVSGSIESPEQGVLIRPSSQANRSLKIYQGWSVLWQKAKIGNFDQTERFII